MALVAGTALLMAAIFLLFKAFAVRRIPLLPAIAVNYLVACRWTWRGVHRHVLPHGAER